MVVHLRMCGEPVDDKFPFCEKDKSHLQILGDSFRGIFTGFFRIGQAMMGTICSLVVVIFQFIIP
jgi:hypothetical protein